MDCFEMKIIGDINNFTWGGRDGAFAVQSGPDEVCPVFINAILAYQINRIHHWCSVGTGKSQPRVHRYSGKRGL